MTQLSRAAYLRSATLFATLCATVISPANGFNGLPVSAFRNINRLSFSGHSKVPVSNVGSNADDAPRPLFHNDRFASFSHQSVIYRMSGSRMRMVRNVDLPEALVFYGMESIFDPPIVSTHENDSAADVGVEYVVRLRPGVARILDECREVGTAALILSESNILEEEELKDYFAMAWINSCTDSASQARLQKLMDGSIPVVSFRCINSPFTLPASVVDDDEGMESAETQFYNLRSTGRSPSPAFLLDSLQSIHIDPRGFGGSSGFARGQWIEPRRSPMTARTVVFVSGDWNEAVQYFPLTNKIPWLSNSSVDSEENVSLVRDRCAAVRAAGCRIIYLENTHQSVPILDDSLAISLCDAVVTSYGNDNPRDVQPITLDAISTPGDYWLNPPCPRDDAGNSVVADDVVEWFRSEREMRDAVGDAGCIVRAEEEVEDQMSEDEMERILADLDKI